MTIQFVVETGSGSSTANSYVTVAQANQYLENSGRKAGAWDKKGNSGKEEALIRAFYYMIARWAVQWHGIQANEDQTGDWPRRQVFKKSGHAYASTEIAVAVKNSQIEYALIEATNSSSLFPNPEYSDTSRTQTQKREKVGPIETEDRFSENRAPTTFRKFPMADNLLKHLVTSGSQSELLRM